MKISPKAYPILVGATPEIAPAVKEHLDSSEFSKEYWAGYETLCGTEKTRIVRKTIIDHITDNVVKQLSSLSVEAKIEPCWYIYKNRTVGIARVAPDLVFIMIAMEDIVFCAGGLFTDNERPGEMAYDLGIISQAKNPDFYYGFSIAVGGIVPVFIEFAEIETVVMSGKPNMPKRYKVDDEKYLNMIDIDVEIIDSRWFRNITRDEEFGVRGHFRLQPHGPNHSMRKLIYVNDFVKHGYHRGAGKQSNTTTEVPTCG